MKNKAIESLSLIYVIKLPNPLSTLLDYLDNLLEAINTT